MITGDTPCDQRGCRHPATMHGPDGNGRVRCWKTRCKCTAFVSPPGTKQVALTPGGRFAVPDDDFFTRFRREETGTVRVRFVHPSGSTAIDVPSSCLDGIREAGPGEITPEMLTRLRGVLSGAVPVAIPGRHHDDKVMAAGLAALFADRSAK